MIYIADNTHSDFLRFQKIKKYFKLTNFFKILKKLCYTKQRQ